MRQLATLLCQSSALLAWIIAARTHAAPLAYAFQPGRPNGLRRQDGAADLTKFAGIPMRMSFGAGRRGRWVLSLARWRRATAFDAEAFLCALIRRVHGKPGESA
jgi:hypothetical protein